MSLILAVPHPCHTPRKRDIQYAALFRFVAGAAEYWIIRLRG
jgi:hypothetical protein